MPVSKISMKNRYSLILSFTDQDAKIAMGMRKVVSKTRKRLIPSMPTSIQFRRSASMAHAPPTASRLCRRQIGLKC